MEFILLCGSIVLLYFGADGLVSGSSKLGLKLGLSPLVIGLTVVAYGTSFPELIVSVQSALKGLDGIAVGNVIGSNSFNIAVILGISACVFPQRVNSRLIARDVPIMVFTALLVWVFLADGSVARAEGLILAFGILLYTWFNVRNVEKDPDVNAWSSSTSDNWCRIFMLIVGGLLLLALGSTLLVKSASAIASTMGVSDAVIGLTIVAAGTSMPELATSLVAAIKKQPDIAIGNVVGSNVYNSLCILGISSIIHPLSSAGITRLDIIFMVGLSLLLWPIVCTKRLLERWEGALLVIAYGLYLWAILP